MPTIAKLAGLFDNLVAFLSDAEQGWQDNDPLVTRSYDLRNLARQLYSGLFDFHYLEKSDDNKQWWFTERGIEYHSTLWHKDQDSGLIEEDNLYYVINGFVAGLFNTNNHKLSRVYDDEPRYIINTNFGTVIVDTITDLIDDIESEQIHGPDLTAFAFDIIREYNGVARLFYAAHGRYYGDGKNLDESVDFDDVWLQLNDAFQGMLDECFEFKQANHRSCELMMILIGFGLSMLIDQH